MPLEHIVFTLPDALTAIQLLINKGSGKVDPAVDTHCLLKAGLVILGYANDQVMSQPPQERPPETYTMTGDAPVTAFNIHLETLKKAEAELYAAVVARSATDGQVSHAVSPIWWMLLDAVPDLVRELINKYLK